MIIKCKQCKTFFEHAVITKKRFYCDPCQKIVKIGSDMGIDLRNDPNSDEPDMKIVFGYDEVSVYI